MKIVITKDVIWQNRILSSIKMKSIIKIIERYVSKNDVIILKKTKLLNVYFTTNTIMKNYNHTYRGADKSTNVLSFTSTNRIFLLGNILFSFQDILHESVQQNKPFRNHLIHLFVHSLLHLLGYDHVNDKDANKMESLEISILQDMNIANPYLLD
jgi:probable rRNA maturation factor